MNNFIIFLFYYIINLENEKLFYTLLVAKKINLDKFFFLFVSIVLKKLPNATKDEMFNRVYKFLAESGDREGGRKAKPNAAN